MRSLWTKLIGAFGLVILVGTGMVVWLAGRATAGQFELYVTQTGRAWAERLAPTLAEYYAQTGSWDGVEHILQQSSAYTAAPGAPNTGWTESDSCISGKTGRWQEGRWQDNHSQGSASKTGSDSCTGDDWMMDMWTIAGNRLVLADENWVIVADTANALVGTRLLADDIARGTPVLLGGRPIGTLIVTPFNTPASPADDFLRATQRSVLWAGISAGAVALVLGSLLFFQITHPLRSLSSAAQSIARGDLSQRAWASGDDEIGQVARSFNQMAEKLQRYEAERQNMTADIAHELRTPLAVIQSNLEAMMDGVLPADGRELALLHQEALLLKRLISDLRTLSLADAGQLTLHRRPVNLRELAAQVVERLQLRIEEKNIHLRVNIPESIPTVSADPERLAQVLSNLIDNALRYTPDGTRIVIAARATDGEVEVSVSDDGPGIPPEELPNLFRRFWRAEKSRNRATGGSGLGLAIVKQLVGAHGGRVWAESEGMGKGSRFVFTLPMPLEAISKMIN